MRRALLALLLLSLSGAPSFAAVKLSAILWQAGGEGKGAEKAFAPVAKAVRPPGLRSSGRLRAVATVDNRAGAAIEGLVLHYAVYPKLAPVQGGGPEVWGVPFRAGERRVPRVKAGAVLEVPIDTLKVEAYLASLRSSGVWPTALKVQIMVAPKPGQGLQETLAEAVLPLAWDLPAPSKSTAPASPGR